MGCCDVNIILPGKRCDSEMGNSVQVAVAAIY